MSVHAYTNRRRRKIERERDMTERIVSREKFAESCQVVVSVGVEGRLLHGRDLMRRLIRSLNVQKSLVPT